MNPAVRHEPETEVWLRRFHDTADDRARLVCLPHAGGSASYFHPMSAALAPRVSAYAVQYPGRQDRRREPCIDTIPQLADAIFEVLADWIGPDGEPPALFGHSMGATLAFELAVRMEQRLDRSPRALFVSGRRAPSRFRAETVHTRDDAGIIAELAELSGTAPGLLDDPEVVAMVLPMLRSDYRAIETYRGRAQDAVSCPVTVLTGRGDTRVSAQDADAWAQHTRGAFTLRTFAGGHFFLGDHWPAIAGMIGDELAVAAG